MSTRHLVDPQLLPVLEQLPVFDLSAATLKEVRALAAQSASQMPASTPRTDVVVTERRAPGPQGAPQVRVLVFTPAKADGLRPAYLHIHGGGFVMGSPERSRDYNVELACDLGCVVVSVDYRLAPETPFPGAIEDCYAALAWLHSSSAELGVDARRIAIGGESAGGSLAACLAILARDRGGAPLIFQRLMCPGLDDRTPSGDWCASVGEFVWTRENNAFAWKCMLGAQAGGPEVSPYAAAARVEDVRGLPPAFIGVGSLDLHVEDAVLYATRLLHAGVPTELHVYPGAFHGFEMSPDADVARASRQNAKNALRRAFDGPIPSRSL